jgi:hypothetical protein
MNEVLIAFAAAAVAALALTADPRIPSEMTGSRMAQAAPPAEQPAPSAEPSADDREDDDDGGPGADDDRDDD